MTSQEQQALLRPSSGLPRNHLVFSLALGTGLRLAEVVSLNVDDVYFPDGSPWVRFRLRSEIAKNGPAGDVFLDGRVNTEAIAIPELHTSAL